MNKENIEGTPPMKSINILKSISSQNDQNAAVNLLKMNNSFSKIIKNLPHGSGVKAFHNSQTNPRYAIKSPNLIKNMTKIEENIKMNQSRRKICSSVTSNQEKQLKLVFKDRQSKYQNKVLEYFTPKTKEEIISQKIYEFRNKSNLDKKQYFNSTSSSFLSKTFIELEEGGFKNSSKTLHSHDSSKNLSKEAFQKETINLTKRSSVFQKIHVTSKQENKFKIHKKSRKQLQKAKHYKFYSQINSFKVKTTNEQQNNSKKSVLTLFTRLQLQSYFKSLLQFSKSCPNSFTKGFEIMLSLMNVSISEKIAKKWIDLFTPKNITSFEQFVYIYKRIMESILKEAIIDYFQIILENFQNQEISSDLLIDLFAERMEKKISQEIVQEIYMKLQKQMSSLITKKQIFSLCYNDEGFCTKIRQFQILELQSKQKQ